MQHDDMLTYETWNGNYKPAFYLFIYYFNISNFRNYLCLQLTTLICIYCHFFPPFDSLFYDDSE